MSAAFAGQQLVQFGREAIALGAKLDGIEKAFQSISDSGKTSMNELKKGY